MYVYYLCTHDIGTIHPPFEKVIFGNACLFVGNQFKASIPQRNKSSGGGAARYGGFMARIA